jgi:hypothetical protein
MSRLADPWDRWILETPDRKCLRRLARTPIMELGVGHTRRENPLSPRMAGGLVAGGEA